MTTLVTISADPILQFLGNDGKPLVGGMLTTLVGGLPYPTWGDAAAQFELPNPIILNSRGEVCNQTGQSTPLYVQTNTAYTYLLQDSLGNTIWTGTINSLSQAAVLSVLTAEALASILTAEALGEVLYPLTQAEINANVVVNNFSYVPGRPERYMPLATSFTYASADGTVGDDFSAAINAALICVLQPCILGPFNYLANANNLVMPNEQSLIGEGLNISSIILSPTYTGIAINWNQTNASRIQLEGFTLFCNNYLVSGSTTVLQPKRVTGGGIVLGSSTNPAPYGTEPYIHNVLVRDLQVPAFDIYSNIGEFGNIYALNSAGIRLMGTGVSILALENTNPSGFLDGNGNMTCTEVQDGRCAFYELEAAQSSNLLITYQGNFDFASFVPSFAPSTTFAELIYISNSVNNWSCNLSQVYYSGGAGSFATFTAVGFDQNKNVFFGAGNTANTQAPKNMCANYCAGIVTQGNTFGIKLQQLTNFSLQIANVAGTISHKITASGQTGVPGNWITTIGGDSINYTPTPNIGNAVDFAAGAGINGTTPSQLVLNSGAEIPVDIILFPPVLTLKGTGTDYTVRATTVNLNVNGVTQNWLAFELHAAAVGTAAVSWATALATPNWLLEITFGGFVR